MKKVGIALGGGGARGLAHIGILRILEKENIPISYIAGTSIGAIVGAMYAQTPDSNVLLHKFMDTLESGFYQKIENEFLKSKDKQNFFQRSACNLRNRIALNLAPTRESLLKNIKTKEMLRKLVSDGDIRDTKIPLNIVSTNIQNGEDVVFKRGDIIQAVLASSSVTGFLAPIYIDKNVLTDGAVSCPVPVNHLKKMGADITIGVDISVEGFDYLEKINVLDCMTRAYDITIQRYAKLITETADISIYPHTGNIHWSEFSKYEQLIIEGIKSIVPMIPKLKELIKKRRFWQIWKRNS